MTDSRRRPVDPIVLALAAAIREIAARRAAEGVERRRSISAVGAKPKPGGKAA